jgi:hypothetical protein
MGCHTREELADAEDVTEKTTGTRGGQKTISRKFNEALEQRFAPVQFSKHLAASLDVVVMIRHDDFQNPQLPF